MNRIEIHFDSDSDSESARGVAYPRQGIRPRFHSGSGLFLRQIVARKIMPCSETPLEWVGCPV